MSSSRGRPTASLISFPVLHSSSSLDLRSSKLDYHSRIEAIRLHKVVATLIRNESGLMSFVFKTTVEMSVSERPYRHTFRGEANLLGQISHETR